MTWGEFKAWMEAQGVRDDEEIRYMDWAWTPERVGHDDDDDRPMVWVL